MPGGGGGGVEVKGGVDRALSTLVWLKKKTKKHNDLTSKNK